jgi:indole-3-glycerol phosphate synthase
VATYLDRIIDWHRSRAADAGLHRPEIVAARCDAALAAVQELPRRGFSSALRSGSGDLRVIAEVKRRSPSKGDLAADLDPVLVAQDYAAGGAACLSVLTDGPHFGGSPQDLAAARGATALPVIRKDFTVCEVDVYDAAIMGADAVLLIVAALTNDELRCFADAARSLDLAILWETHDEHEVERILPFGPAIIGVNQRDLHTFQVDQQRAVRVARSIPTNVIRVAESGVRGPQDAQVLAAAGYDAILVGESVVTSGNRAGAVRALIDGARVSSINGSQSVTASGTNS